MGAEIGSKLSTRRARLSQSASHWIRSARVPMILASIAVLLLSAPGPAAASTSAHQPDLEISASIKEPWGERGRRKGLGVFESWPNDQQLNGVTVPSGSCYAGYCTYVYVGVYNAGSSTDSFRISGEPTYAGVHVRYLRNWGDGGDVTSAVVAGRYVISNVPPGERARGLLIRVTAPFAPVGFKRTVRVFARTVGKPHAMDAVSFGIRVTE